MLRGLPHAIVLSLSIVATIANSTDLQAADAAVDYLKDIKPLLTAKCVACHGGLRQKSNLRLDTVKFAFKGGDNGPAIKAGDSSNSPLIEAVLGTSGRTKMPIDAEELKPDQIDIIRRWIDAGAKAPDDEPVADPRDHWAFKKPVGQVFNLPRPAGQVENLPHKNPIDSFLAVEHAARNLTPFPEADKATLLRRVYLDLIGLPPSRDELHDFLNDTEPDAYERVVERLLTSEHFGERWARWWLDLAHYADSDGYLQDFIRPVAWRFRQWVVDAFNRDLPFDQFTIEQLAGDLLPNARHHSGWAPASCATR